MHSITHGLINVVWNSDEVRLRAFWRLALHAALWLLIGRLLRPVSVALFRIASTQVGDMTAIGQQVTGISVTLVAVLASTWLAARYIDRRKFSDFGLVVDTDWWLDFLFGLFLGALLMSLVFALESRMGWIIVRARWYVGAEGELPFAIIILGPLFVFIAVGIAEEILSTGYQMRNMAEGFNFGNRRPSAAVVAAWLASSFVFGLLHVLNPNATLISTAYLMLAGLFLGLGLLLTGKLGLPIGLHISWNFVQGNVYGFPVSGLDMADLVTFVAIEQTGPELWTGGAFGPEAGLMGLGAIALGCLLTIAWVRLRYGRVAIYRDYAIYRPSTAIGHTAAPAEDSLHR